MAINFPATPTLNQTYTFNGRTWTYNGVGWQATGASGLSVYTKTDFTATAAQTTFTVAYTVGFVDVYYNGSKLSITEYTATNGTSVVLGTACAVNDIVETVAWTVSTTLNPALGVATATSLAIGGATIGSNALAVTGTTALSGLLTAAGGVSSTLTTDATSATTGSILTAGGISMQKALWVGTTSRLVGAVTMNAALTYGGVTLSNAVTGTGNMVLSASPTLTGTLTAAAANFSGNVSSATEFRLAQTYLRVATVADAGGWTFGGGYNFAFNSGVGWKHDSTGSLSGVAYNNTGSIGFFAAGSAVAGTAAAQVATFASNLLTLSQPLNYGGVTLSNAVTGTGNMVLSASPTLTGTLTAATVTASGRVTGSVGGTFGPTVSGGSTVTTFISSDNSTDQIALEVRQGRYNKDTLILSTNQTNSANFLNVIENGSSKFTISTNGNTAITGNVGIGMTPSYQLDITQVSGNVGIRVNGTNPIMRWNQTGTGANVWRWQAQVVAAGDFGIYNETTTNTPYRITSADVNTFSTAMSYGGVTLSNSVTGTGSMVLSAAPTLTGITSAASLYTSGTLRAMGNTTPASGSGMEMIFASSVGTVLTYNRTGSAYLETNVAGLGVSLLNQNQKVITVTASNGIQFPLFGAGTVTSDASGNITSVSDPSQKIITGEYKLGLKEIVAAASPEFMGLHTWTKESGMETEGEYASFFARDSFPIPNAVAKNQKTGINSFSDRPVIMALVNAVAELTTRLAALESK